MKINVFIFIIALTVVCVSCACALDYNSIVTHIYNTLSIPVDVEDIVYERFDGRCYVFFVDLGNNADIEVLLYDTWSGRVEKLRYHRRFSQSYPSGVTWYTSDYMSEYDADGIRTSSLCTWEYYRENGDLYLERDMQFSYLDDGRIGERITTIRNYNETTGLIRSAQVYETEYAYSLDRVGYKNTLEYYDARGRLTMVISNIKNYEHGELYVEISNHTRYDEDGREIYDVYSSKWAGSTFYQEVVTEKEYYADGSGKERVETWSDFDMETGNKILERSYHMSFDQDGNVTGYTEERHDYVYLSSGWVKDVMTRETWEGSDAHGDKRKVGETVGWTWFNTLTGYEIKSEVRSRYDENDNLVSREETSFVFGGENNSCNRSLSKNITMKYDENNGLKMVTQETTVKDVNGNIAFASGSIDIYEDDQGQPRKLTVEYSVVNGNIVRTTVWDEDSGSIIDEYTYISTADLGEQIYGVMSYSDDNEAQARLALEETVLGTYNGDVKVVPELVGGEENIVK